MNITVISDIKQRILFDTENGRLRWSKLTGGNLWTGMSPAYRVDDLDGFFGRNLGIQFNDSKHFEIRFTYREWRRLRSVMADSRGVTEQEALRRMRA